MCSQAKESSGEPRLSSADRSRWLQTAESRLGYTFKSASILEESLTHRSYSQLEGQRNYERLEFLGDALLELVVSQELLERFPAANEGDLTRMRASLVSRDHLSQLASHLEFGDLILLGRGEEKSQGRGKRTILADVFESVAGAIFLDGGLEAGRQFLLRHLESDLVRFDSGKFQWRDHKSRLQEILHSLGKAAPVYRVVEEAGPPHERIFKIEVQIDGRAEGRASGRSKKKAEQRAAAEALQELQEEEEG